MTEQKIRIDADLLTAKDMRRARVALGGRDPWELLRGEQEDRAVLIAWCQLSRDNPGLTWDEVEAMPFGTYVEVEEEEEQRPPEGLSSSNGSRPEKTGKTTSGATASRSRSSAASTT